jgi:hypothetical protein
LDENPGCFADLTAADGVPVAMYSLIATVKMNGVGPQTWLADVLARIAAHPAHRLPIKRAYADKGYRGHKATNPRRVFVSGRSAASSGSSRELRRRSAIEPVIGRG